MSIPIGGRTFESASGCHVEIGARATPDRMALIAVTERFDALVFFDGTTPSRLLSPVDPP